MGEGLKIVNDIYIRAVANHDVPHETYLGIAAAVTVLSDPENADLWERLKAYCEEEQHTTLEELQDIRKRAELATPGRWFVNYGTVVRFQNRPRPDAQMACLNVNDANFIAHAREDILALLAEVERLAKEQQRAILRALYLPLHRWKSGLSVRGRRQLICTDPDCPNPAGPRAKTHGQCWKHWWTTPGGG